MVLDSNSDPDVTVALGDKQASHIILPTAFISSILPLSTEHEPFLFLSHFSTIFAHHNGVYLVVTGELVDVPSLPKAVRTQAGL